MYIYMYWSALWSIQHDFIIMATITIMAKDLLGSVISWYNYNILFNISLYLCMYKCIYIFWYIFILFSLFFGSLFLFMVFLGRSAQEVNWWSSLSEAPAEAAAAFFLGPAGGRPQRDHGVTVRCSRVILETSLESNAIHLFLSVCTFNFISTVDNIQL